MTMSNVLLVQYLLVRTRIIMCCELSLTLTSLLQYLLVRTRINMCCELYAYFISCLSENRRKQLCSVPVAYRQNMYTLVWNSSLLSPKDVHSCMCSVPVACELSLTLTSSTACQQTDVNSSCLSPKDVTKLLVAKRCTQLYVFSSSCL